MLEALALATIIIVAPKDHQIDNTTVLQTQVWNATPDWIDELGKCIRHHESHSNYKAKDPRSTASGAYSFLDATWQGNAKWTVVNGAYVARGYEHAKQAPPWVQDAVFVHAIKRGGIKAWHGTNCKGT